MRFNSWITHSDDGVHIMSLKEKKGSHVIDFVRKAGMIYILDPNIPLYPKLNEESWKWKFEYQLWAFTEEDVKSGLLSKRFMDHLKESHELKPGMNHRFLDFSKVEPNQQP